MRLDAEWPAALAGRVLCERYQLETVLGVGGMGAVMRATHLGTGRAVAVKLMLPTLLRDADLVKRFHLEARAAAAVGHRGVVQVLDLATDSEAGPVLVLELLEGESLLTRLNRLGRLAPEAAVRLGAEMLDTLVAVHARGIVHRDLKPANVFLAREDGDERVKLVDFGIARVEHAMRTGRLTMPGTALGTPRFMAPEQARGEMDLDARADLYAVGAMLYFALSGRPPYADVEPTNMLVAVLRGPPARLASVVDDVPAQLVAVVDRAMARDADARFQTAAEMREALAGAADGPMPSRATPTALGRDEVSTVALPEPHGARPSDARAQTLDDASATAWAKPRGVASAAASLAEGASVPATRSVPPARESESVQNGGHATHARPKRSRLVWWLLFGALGVGALVALLAVILIVASLALRTRGQTTHAAPVVILPPAVSAPAPPAPASIDVTRLRTDVDRALTLQQGERFAEAKDLLDRVLPSDAATMTAADPRAPWTAEGSLIRAVLVWELLPTTGGCATRLTALRDADVASRADTARAAALLPPSKVGCGQVAVATAALQTARALEMSCPDAARLANDAARTHAAVAANETHDCTANAQSLVTESGSLTQRLAGPAGGVYLVPQ